MFEVFLHCSYYFSDAYYSRQSEDLTEFNVKNLLEADKSTVGIDSHVYEKVQYLFLFQLF